MNFIKKFWTAIQVSDNDQFLQAIEKRDLLVTELNNQIKEFKKSNDGLISDNDRLFQQLKALNDANKSIINEFLESKYLVIENFAYKDKQKFMSKYYSVFLNELITPDAFEVEKIKRKLKLTGNTLTDAQIIGDKVAELLTWTDDKNLDTSGDLYLYPAQAVAYKKCDCEDHSFLTASLQPTQFGVAYGFYYPETFKKNKNNKFGHAFNVFSHDNRLFILDTVGNVGVIEEYTGLQHYTINYIVTKDKSFSVDDRTAFGTLAGWD